MNDFFKLRPTVRAYVTCVVLVGAAALADSIHRLYVNPIGQQWFVLAVLTLLTGSFSVKVPSINAYISISETFVFVSVLLFGAPAGTVTVLLECLVIVFWMKPQGRPGHRLLFNVAAPAVAIWISGTTFFLLSGIEPYSRYATPLQQLFFPLLAFTALYFLLNSWLVAIAVGLENDKSPVKIWWNNFAWLSVNYFSGASVAALIVNYTRELDFSTLVIIVPLLVVFYLTFRTATGRAEDSYNHLTELNRLYLSTIETLAMAIDAKDQITHGHIRRVQTYAVGLAKRVGVTEEKLIKAIEAAALLHDMGKLAVPEYILNKPGKLTDAEFEKMKLHASVGADILSAINFPYPVVPIVRHNHENWDGTGYPAKLKGTEIPIGARILSVVDCFDALTSDRPYRPRLSDPDAIQILISRRGTMYDPLIVDTFIHSHSEFARDIPTTNVPKHVLNEITNSTQSPNTVVEIPRFDDIAASSDEMLTLYELAGGLAGQASISDTGDVIAKHLRRLIPFAQSVLFLYDSPTDELVVKHAVGDASYPLKGFRIPLGQRLSGWVGANRKTIVNSDPVLDLGEMARSLSPRLRSCLSTPLICDDHLVGVLTLYSALAEGFNDDHRRVIEVVARQIAHTFKCAAEHDSSPKRDALTGLPTLEHLQQLVQTIGTNQSANSAITLLFVDIANLKVTNDEHGRSVGDEVLKHVARHISSCLSMTDILFRHRSDEFVALINDPDGTRSQILARKIRENVRAHPLFEERLMIAVEVTIVSAPRDGNSLPELIAKGRKSSAHNPKESSPIIH
jgi:diguanylate cyclase (GGDEF)-like protein/putative nucleotidyltransferase with HDIG domain